MHITLYRHAGWEGRLVPMDVLVNDVKVCAIGRKETKIIALPDKGGTLRVEMQGLISSQDTFISSTENGKAYECGTSWWVPFDVIGISLIRPFKRQVFYVRPANSGKGASQNV